MEVEKEDPILGFAEIEDEDLKAGKGVPEAELNMEPPEDKEARERDEAGKFKAKDGDKKEEKKDDKPDAKKEETKVEKKTDDSVPLAKFLDERAKFKAEIEQRDLTLKQMQARMDEWEKKHAPKPEAEPDFVDDPQGYVDTKLSKVLSTLEETRKTATEQGTKAEATAREARETAEIHGFMQNLAQHEAAYVAKNPDYYDALAHVRQIRAYQLEQFEPGITPEKINEIIRREELALAVNLARAGRDPVATAHELARRYGYQPKAPPTKQQQAPTNTNRLPPDQTLGGGQGAPDLSGDDENDRKDEVDTALASLFKKRA
jgi:hypothetical protein